MKHTWSAVKRFFQEEDAPTMVEYGLLVAVIAMVVLVGAQLLGVNLLALFNRVAAVLPGI